MSGDRWVLHVDMDAFYASVEAREDPALRGRPVVVGGTGNRGVVASASYEARSFGVRSAMPAAHARRLCPHAVFLPPHFALYHSYSERLHEIFGSFTPLVEGIGLDEAFLDVSGATILFGPPARMAAQLHQRVAAELGLCCSVGAGPSKLVAKLASKAAKPRPSEPGPICGPGTVVVSEAEVLGFMWPLPVEALWGVGPASGERLRRLGVTTVGELAALPASAVISALGRSAGQLLHSLAWGRDERPVVPDRAVKSIGHEETYPIDLVDRHELERRLVVMADSVAGKVREQGLVARTVTVKLRYADFSTLTRSHTFASPQGSGPSFWTAARALLGTLELKNGARLLGISASGLLPAASSPGEQLQLELSSPAPANADGTSPDAGGAAEIAGAGGAAAARGRPPRPGRVPPTADGPSWTKASEAVDAVRARFGETALRPATSVAPPSTR